MKRSNRNSNRNLTTHEFRSRSMSPLQWTALKILTSQARHGKRDLTLEEVASYKQTTMGSFAQRKYLRKISENHFEITETALRARSEFDAADVMRQAKSLKLSIRFGSQSPRVIEMVKRKAAGA